MTLHICCEVDAYKDSDLISTRLDSTVSYDDM